VLSRKISRHKPQRVHDAIWYARIESAGALLVSFFLNLAVVAVNATNFYDTKCAALDDGPYACMSIVAYNTSGQDGDPVPCGEKHGVCGDFGLLSEGYALADSALGNSSIYIWAFGLFAAGQAATMVCTYAGQIIMGGTLQIQLSPWVRVAITRIFALGPALVVATVTIRNQRLFNSINEYLNILQSVQLPFAMLPVLHFAAQKDLLGRFRSGMCLTVISTVLALLVIGVSVVLIVQFIADYPPGAIAAVCVYGVLYFGVCIRMVWSEIVAITHWAASLLGLTPRARTVAAADASGAAVPLA